jgi:hypothetical protein
MATHPHFIRLSASACDAKNKPVLSKATLNKPRRAGILLIPFGSYRPCATSSISNSLGHNLPVTNNLFVEAS